ADGAARHGAAPPVAGHGRLGRGGARGGANRRASRAFHARSGAGPARGTRGRRRRHELASARTGETRGIVQGNGQDGSISRASFFYRVGGFSYRRRRWVLGVWVAVLLAMFPAVKSLSNNL